MNKKYKVIMNFVEKNQIMEHQELEIVEERGNKENKVKRNLLEMVKEKLKQ